MKTLHLHHMVRRQRYHVRSHGLSGTSGNKGRNLIKGILSGNKAIEVIIHTSATNKPH